MKQTRIIVLANAIGTVGGIQRYTFDLIRAIDRDGYSVNAYARSRKSAGAAFYSLSTPSRLISRFWNFWATASVRRLSRRGDIVLILAAHPELAGLARLLARERGIPYAVCTYGIEVWGKWKPEAAQALRQADRVLTISQFTYEKLIANGLDPRKIVLLPFGVDLEEYAFAKREPGRGKTLLTVARLDGSEKYKGHDFVIQCLPDLLKDFPDLEYRIVGTGDDQARLRSLAENAGIGRRVRFLGGLGEKEVIAEYQSADAFVMLSQTGPRADGRWMGEGFGRVYLEAAACGCPVLAADEGGAREAILDGVTGYLIKSRDKRAFLSAVTGLFKNEALRYKMGMAGRKFVAAKYSQVAFEKNVHILMGGLAEGSHA